MNAHFVPAISGDTFVPSAYRASRRNRPFALLGSAGLATGMISAFLLMNAVIVPKAKPHALTVNLLELQSPPPEEKRQPIEKPKEIHAQPQIVSPPPLVNTPTPPAQVAVTPEPPKVDAPAPPAPASPPAPPAAPARSGAAESRDLTGNLLSAQPPSYPTESRRLHEQGVVVLLLQISTSGTVDEISIARSSGSARLDKAALSAVRRWRWTPFRHDGELVIVKGQVTIPFVLKG